MEGEDRTAAPSEAPEAKAARERLTGLLVLVAIVLGVAAGVATGDGGLGFGVFIASCLVFGVYLQRNHPPPNAEPPPRWGMVLSFIAGPILIAAGVWNIVSGEPVEVGEDATLLWGDDLSGVLRIVCGVISIWFAFDQRRLRETRAAAIRAIVREGLREATLHVGAGWSRDSLPRRAVPEPDRERVPDALAREWSGTGPVRDADVGGSSIDPGPPGPEPLALELIGSDREPAETSSAGEGPAADAVARALDDVLGGTVPAGPAAPAASPETAPAPEAAAPESGHGASVPAPVPEPALAPPTVGSPEGGLGPPVDHRPGDDVDTPDAVGPDVAPWDDPAVAEAVWAEDHLAPEGPVAAAGQVPPEGTLAPDDPASPEDPVVVDDLVWREDPVAGDEPVVPEDPAALDEAAVGDAPPASVEPVAEAGGAVPDWFAAMWDGPGGDVEPEAEVDQRSDAVGDAAPPRLPGAPAGPVAPPPPRSTVAVGDLPPLPRRVRGASLFRPSRLPGSLDEPEAVPEPAPTAEPEAVPEPTSTAKPLSVTGPTSIGGNAAPEPTSIARPEPTSSVGARGVDAEAPGSPARSDDQVVDLAEIERDEQRAAEQAEAAEPAAPGAEHRGTTLPRGIRILRKREPRPEFDTDEVV